jgi:GT2 family glycosyltransferase
MKLSVIIVNYNVKHFLEQALLSVRRAAEGLAVDVWVVDNISSDDSVAMVKAKFPEVNLIENKENVGFSKANNQAIRASQGEYVLLLNPDTVVSEDTFQKCLAFMDTHAEAGGLGVKTIDGSGAFLPESKRGFPSPWVAFCKSFGLSAMFPKSSFFNWYYMGHLSKDETHATEVLVGSFMLMRRSVLDKIGLLDEAFFMYGEDIDLSYRIVNQGFKNYYFSDTTVIHYKGESTKKGSLNYVRVFYGAMIIFAKKHFQGQKAALFIGLMLAAVWFRAGLTLLAGLLKKIYLPILDTLLIFLGLFLLKDFWSIYYFKEADYIKPTFLYVNSPLYIMLWLSSIYFSGGYDKPVSLRRILRGVIVGTVILSAVYGFLNTEFRSSRMLIVLGALWTGLSLVASRLLLHFLENRNFRLGTEGVKNLVIVGEKDEAERVKNLLNQAQISKNLIGIVSPKDNFDTNFYLSPEKDLDKITRLFNVQEIIFCSKDLENQRIMQWMQRLGDGIEYRILPEGGTTIIGSSDKNTTGELYASNVQFKIASPMNKRNKRVLDIFLCFLFIIFSPLIIIALHFNLTIFKSIIPVLFGQKTWVGYHGKDIKNLPKIKESVFSPLNQKDILSESVLQKMNYFYAKDYDVWHDVMIVWKALRLL